MSLFGRRTAEEASEDSQPWQQFMSSMAASSLTSALNMGQYAKPSNAMACFMGQLAKFSLFITGTAGSLYKGVDARMASKSCEPLVESGVNFDKYASTVVMMSVGPQWESVVTTVTAEGVHTAKNRGEVMPEAGCAYVIGARLDPFVDQDFDAAKRSAASKAKAKTPLYGVGFDEKDAVCLDGGWYFSDVMKVGSKDAKGVSVSVAVVKPPDASGRGGSQRPWEQPDQSITLPAAIRAANTMTLQHTLTTMALANRLPVQCDDDDDDDAADSRDELAAMIVGDMAKAATEYAASLSAMFGRIGHESCAEDKFTCDLSDLDEAAAESVSALRKMADALDHGPQDRSTSSEEENSEEEDDDAVSGSAPPDHDDVPEDDGNTVASDGDGQASEQKEIKSNDDDSSSTDSASSEDDAVPADETPKRGATSEAATLDASGPPTGRIKRGTTGDDDAKEKSKKSRPAVGGSARPPGAQSTSHTRLDGLDVTCPGGIPS